MKIAHMIELSHLKIVHALETHGTLTEAASSLCLSQSALSHQIRYLEKKMEIKLWQRHGRHVLLTQAGQQLLTAAKQVLPVISQCEQTLSAYRDGKQGVLRIGVECYPCYQWIASIIGDYLERLPDVEIEIINQFQFSGLDGLLNHHIDILITPDPVKNAGLHFEPISHYEMMIVMAQHHPLACKAALTPEDLANEVLLSFPVPQERLDIINNFFQPAQIRPLQVKEITSIDVMIQMTALQRGYCVLPEWLADRFIKKNSLKKIKIGKKGLHKSLLVGVRNNDIEINYMNEFIKTAKKTSFKTLDE